MKRILVCLFVAWSLVPAVSVARDLLRICVANYPGGCSYYVYDYRYYAYDFSALWCEGELIYEQSGFGGSIGQGGNCVYFA